MTEAGSGEAGDGFHLVFVCTGNICRSPTAELLARHLLRGRLGGREAARFHVSSVGMRAVSGAPMHPLARQQLAPWGLDGAHAGCFVARQLRRGIVDDADLVLGMSPRHRSAVLEELPHLLDRTFSLREFARLTSSIPTDALPPDPVDRTHAVVADARALRGRVPAPEHDHVPDPMGGSSQAHRLATTLIFDALRTILGVVAPRSAPDRRPSGTEARRQSRGG